MLLRKLFETYKSKKVLLLTWKFECLPNELILPIFDCLHCHEIIYAFINLNHRFQSLLSSYLPYHLSNSSQLSKSKFKLMQQLPFNIEHVRSLTLFNRIYSIIDVDQFLSIYPINLLYGKLKALSLDFDEEFPYSLIVLLPSFQQLTHLSLFSVKRYVVFSRLEGEHISNIIFFEIKTLKYFQTNGAFVFPKMISDQKSTIEHFQFHNLSFHQFTWLYLHTFNLKSMSIKCSLDPFHDHQPQTFERLVCLKLKRIHSIEDLQLIFEHFQNLNNLKHLELHEFQGNSDGSSFDGCHLENSIRQYIAQLKIFKFFFILHHWDILSKTNELFPSFQSHFWLIEKQWFITFISDERNTSFYYTEPCIRSRFDFADSCMRISTAKQPDNSNIDQLTLSRINSEFIRSFGYFSNIRSLTLTSISPNVTYDQLNTIVNLSSIKHLDWRSTTNYKLLFNILKNSSMEIAFRISYRELLEIHQSERTSIQYFKSVRSLEIADHWFDDLDKKTIRRWCSYFPNVKELFLPIQFTYVKIVYIMDSLQSLSFVVINHDKFDSKINENFIEQLLKSQNKRLGKNKIFHRCSRDAIYLWLE